MNESQFYFEIDLFEKFVFHGLMTLGVFKGLVEIYFKVFEYIPLK